MYISNPEGKLLEVNPALVSILGYDSKEELLEPAARATECGCRRRTRAGTQRQPERPHAHARGSPAKKRWRSRRLRGYFHRRDGSGKIVRYQGTLVDVTEKRALEQQLRRQEEFRRHLLESFPDLILVLDLKGQYTFVSARIAELLGYGPEHLMGKNVEDAENTSPELAALYRTVATGESSLTSCEYGSRHRDGSWRTMLGMASPLLDAEGKPAGVIISVRDVTTEKKLEQQIIQSERLAAMGQMIGGFAHELNNPLTSILGMAELLQEWRDQRSRAQADRSSAPAGAARGRDCAEPAILRPPAGSGTQPGRSE